MEECFQWPVFSVGTISSKRSWNSFLVCLIWFSNLMFRHSHKIKSDECVDAVCSASSSCDSQFLPPQLMAIAETTADRSIQELWFRSQPRQARRPPGRVPRPSHTPFPHPHISSVCAENQTCILLRMMNPWILDRPFPLIPQSFSLKRKKGSKRINTEQRKTFSLCCLSSAGVEPQALWEFCRSPADRHLLSILSVLSQSAQHSASEWMNSPSMAEDAMRGKRWGPFNLTDPTWRPELLLVRLSSNTECPERDYNRAIPLLSSVHLPSFNLFILLYSFWMWPNYCSFYNREAVPASQICMRPFSITGTLKFLKPLFETKITQRNSVPCSPWKEYLAWCRTKQIPPNY